MDRGSSSCSLRGVNKEISGSNLSRGSRVNRDSVGDIVSIGRRGGKMAQLYYRYSTMNAGKSIEVIKVAYNYEERGKRVLALVPGIDNRYGKGKITSRVGLSREATIVNENTNILEIFMRENDRKTIDCVVIDECQVGFSKYMLKTQGGAENCLFREQRCFWKILMQKWELGSSGIRL